ncbi:MAG: chromate efflux transporter, partial [Actinomycetota bacterium]
MESDLAGHEAAPPRPTFSEALRFWLYLGFVNFGGPTGQIAIMHDELVDRRRWIGEDRFLHALSFCMVLPGPEAQQLAIYVGWLLHGTAGGIVAGVLFVLPAATLMLGLAYLYAAHGDVGWVAAVFDGLSAAVVGIVAAATITIARRALKNAGGWIVAAATFLATFVVGIPFPLLILGVGIAGLLLGPEPLGASPTADALPEARRRPSARRTVRVLLIGLAAWWIPLLVVAALTGVHSIYAQQAFFYSQVAVVTFGGAYAVLAYVGREVIARFGLTAADVVAGIGLAETTPGPLILVLEFLGFLAAYRNPGDLSPLVAGTLGAIVTVWATFAASFLFIFLGAPWVEHLRANRRLRGALAGITAAVVGVIAALAVTLAAGVIFDEVRTVHPFLVAIPVPVPSSLDLFALALALAAFAAMWRYRVHV